MKRKPELAGEPPCEGLLIDRTSFQEDLTEASGMEILLRQCLFELTGRDGSLLHQEVTEDGRLEASHARKVATPRGREHVLPRRPPPLSPRPATRGDPA